MIPPYEYRSMCKLDLPHKCEGFKVDDYVEYIKNGIIRKGYIYCFRQAGYKWFAWIYENKTTMEIVNSAFINEMNKIS